MTTWSMDYAFISQDDSMIRDAEARLLDPGHIKATKLVCQDSHSGGVRAHVVKCKGTGDEWIVERTIKDIEGFGYGGCAVKLKCDQESAIMDLQKSICNTRAAKTVPVNSPVGDSQSNGRVENAIRRVQAGIRTLKHATEAEIKTAVSTGHPLFPWLVEWAADLLTRYSVNGSGRTPVQEIRGSKSIRPIAKFGEKILYMPMKLTTRPVTKLEDRYKDRVFLGMRLRSDEIVVGTSEGVIKARSIRRRTVDEQWSAETVGEIKGTLSMPIPGINSGKIPTRAGRDKDDDEDGEPKIGEGRNENGDTRNQTVGSGDQTVERERNEAREEAPPPKMYLKKSDVERFNFTPGCPGCIEI